jgi:uncharacterized membrane protein YbhN (UPF0104 family)
MSRKKAFKIISNSVVFLSLIFLTGYLIKNQQMVFMKIQSVFLFVLSFIFLFGGFFFDAITLKTYLLKNSLRTSYKDSLIMSGKYTLAKYIPGKFGIILGKAVFLADSYPISIGNALQKIFIYQVFLIIASMLISIIPLYGFLFASSEYIIWIVFIMISGIVFFSQPAIQKYFFRVIQKITKKDFGPPVSMEATLFTITLSIVTWSFWAVGFFLLAESIGFNTPFRTAFLFPLASLAGILVLISPGGLGIREGLIVLGFIYYGVPKEQAISLSVYSRLWFVIGEIGFFLVALSFERFAKINQPSHPFTGSPEKKEGG